MKYKHFLALFFNHFIQPSLPTIAKLKSLHGAWRGRFPPLKWFHPFVACPSPHLITSKSPLHKLYALTNPINITAMIRQNTKLPPTARSPRQTWSPENSLHTSNFGPLSRRSVTNPILITVHHLNPPLLHNLFITPHVKHPLQNLPKKVCSPMQIFFMKKVAPYFVGGRGDTMLYLQIFSYF